MDGSHLGFDLSQSSEVKSNFPPHLKLILIVCTNYVRSFMLLQKVHNLAVILLYYWAKWPLFSNPLTQAVHTYFSD